jgi:hypothetical protein
MSFNEQYKREMLEDARSAERCQDFRKARLLVKNRTFEEYLVWLTRMNASQLPPCRPRRVEYKKVLF